jgi:hypothetical protein
MEFDQLIEDFESFKKVFDTVFGGDNVQSLTLNELALFAVAFSRERVKRSPSQVNNFHHSEVTMGSAMNDDRSVHAGGNITGSNIQTGDHSQASLSSVQIPDGTGVDIAAALAELREVLLGFEGVEATRLCRAMDDAQEEAAKPEPDKAEVADSVGRALRHVERAGKLAENIEKVRGLIVTIGGWLGAAAPYTGPLLATVGLTAV